MAIDEEISVRGVFVLADARFDDWSVFQRGETLRDEFLRGSDGLGSCDARLRVGVDGCAVTIVGNFEAAVFEIGHAVKFVAEEEPRGHLRRLETRVAGRGAEEENFCARDEDAVGEEGGEELCEPRAAGKDELRG